MSAILNKFPRISPYIVCFTAALFFAFELMQLHMMNAIAPMVMKEFELTATNFGLLSSTYLLADVIFLIPAGIILDKFSTRKVILSAMILCIAGTFGFAYAQNFYIACFAHFISGIGNAFCFLSCIMLVSRWFEAAKQSFIIGLVITVGMFGGFVAQSPFSALAEAFSWRNALILDGLLGVFILALVWVFVHDKAKTISSSTPATTNLLANLKKCFLSKQNVACGLYVSLMNMPLMIIGAVYGSLFLTQAHGITLTEASFVISMICVGTIIGSPIFGYLGSITQKPSLGNKPIYNFKKFLMGIGSVLSITIFLVIMYAPSSLYNPTANVITLSILFILLGICTSSQVLGYPLITESAEKELTGTSTSVAAVIIMGLPMLIGPMTGKIMDLFSNTDLGTGIVSFPIQSFQIAFLVFPIGFLLSFFLLFAIKEKKAEAVIKH